MKSINNLLKIWLIFLLIILFKTQNTDADLFDIQVFKNNKITGATIDFTNVKTSNNQQIPNMFNITDMATAGYDISSLKIINQGTIESGYTLKYQEKNNINNYCESLNLSIMSSDFLQTFYKGALKDLSISIDINQNDSIFVFVLTQNGQEFNSASCMFDFTLSTPNDWSLSDQETITNYVGK